MIEVLCLLAKVSLERRLCIRNIDLATVVVEDSSFMVLCTSLISLSSDITLKISDSYNFHVPNFKSMDTRFVGKGQYSGQGKPLVCHIVKKTEVSVQVGYESKARFKSSYEVVVIGSHACQVFRKIDLLSTVIACSCVWTVECKISVYNRTLVDISLITGRAQNTEL